MEHKCEQIGNRQEDIRSYYDHDLKKTIYYCHYCGEKLKEE